MAMEAKLQTMEEEAKANGTKMGGKFSEMSQKELEDAMAETRDDLEAAKAMREFNECIDLQVGLEKKVFVSRFHVLKAMI